jgi:DNA helicase-2/ATP-dependent DNA helicase PcrA
MVDAGERPDVILESVLDRTGYLAELEASDDPQDGTRVENLAELVAVAREFSDDPVAGPSADPADVDAGTLAPGLGDFLERVSLVADSDQVPDAPEGEDDGVVTLMTLHTAKGLEFPVVFLVGCEDGLLPLRFGPEPSPTETAEERRLFFVGMTRARSHLFLSHARRRAWRGSVREAEPSPFLADLQAALVDHAQAPARRRPQPPAGDQLSLL